MAMISPLRGGDQVNCAALWGDPQLLEASPTKLGPPWVAGGVIAASSPHTLAARFPSSVSLLAGDGWPYHCSGDGTLGLPGAASPPWAVQAQRHPINSWFAECWWSRHWFPLGRSPLTGLRFASKCHRVGIRCHGLSRPVSCYRVPSLLSETMGAWLPYDVGVPPAGATARSVAPLCFSISFPARRSEPLSSYQSSCCQELRNGWLVQA